MHLYAAYLQEREAFELLHTPEAWASYKCQGDECYIRDIYVSPEARRTNIAASLTDQITIIAKERGCKYLTGTCVPSTNGSTQSLRAMLAYGFNIHSAHQDLIVLRKLL